VIESYTRRTADEQGDRMGKSVLDPTRTERCGGAHFFFYKDGSAVDEQGNPVPYGRTRSPSYEKLRLNHYYTRSLEEAERKLSRRRATTGALRDAALRRLQQSDEGLNQILDETVTSYLPELRRRLAAQPESSN
jgi:hypothetical protein